PLLEEVILRVHALGDFVAAALQHHPSARGEVNPDVRAVELLLNDERRVGDERLGFLWAKVLVVVRALRAEQMRSAGVFDEIVASCAHKVINVRSSENSTLDVCR